MLRVIHYTIKSKGSSGNLTQVERLKTPLDTNEPTAPYIIARELSLRKLPGRQWESNLQPSKQLRSMTIKTSASTETAAPRPIEVCATSRVNVCYLVAKILERSNQHRLSSRMVQVAFFLVFDLGVHFQVKTVGSLFD